MLFGKKVVIELGFMREDNDVCESALPPLPALRLNRSA